MSRADDNNFIISVTKRPNEEFTLSQARCLHISESDATNEFLQARRDGSYGWSRYKDRCEMRHHWGMYLRSNLDWEWDTASCLERLFDLPENVAQPTAPIATVDLDVEDDGTWNLSTTKASPPTKMRVAYKSPTGEIKYRMFVSCPSSENVASVGELAQCIEARGDASAISSEPHSGDTETEDGTADSTYENNDTAPMVETGLELGVKHRFEKQEVSLIPEKRMEEGEDSEVVGYEDNDAALAQEIEFGWKKVGNGDDPANVDNLENRDAIQRQHADQISICSLD